LLEQLVIAKSFAPDNPGLTAKPRQLAFCIVTNIKLCLLDSAGEISPTFQVFNNATVTMSAECV
jgi:hypothetical protein